jgi:DNA-binding NarL/FixJ family response regulator
VISDAPARPVRVCILWQDPLVLAEFQRVLEDRDFDLHAMRLERDQVPSLNEVLPGHADVCVVDLGSRGPDGALIAELSSRGMSTLSVFVAEAFSEATAFQLLRFGTKGLVTHAEASEHLPRILRDVLTGGFWVPRTVLSRFVETTLTESAPRRPAGLAPALTPRERDVLDDLLKNLSNKEIAKRLRISDRTAKFHVSNVLAKYGVKRRADLLLLSFPESHATHSGV